MAGLILYRTAERPTLEIWVENDKGQLIDLSTGYTFIAKIGNPGSAAVFMKSSGIAGAAGNGNEPNGTPNLTITFVDGELDAVPTGSYTWQVRATTGGVDRIFEGTVFIADVIT